MPQKLRNLTPLFYVLDPLAPDHTVEVSLAINLQRTCLVHWPRLDSWNAGESWFERLARSLKPQTDVSTTYPAFVAPAYAFKFHTRLEAVALTWPPVSAFKVPVIAGGGSPGLTDLRPFFVIGEAACFAKIGDHSSFMAFVQKSAAWLVPPSSSSNQKVILLH